MHLPDLPPSIYLPISGVLTLVIGKLWTKWQTCEKVMRKDLRERLAREEILARAGKEHDDEAGDDT